MSVPDRAVTGRAVAPPGPPLPHPPPEGRRGARLAVAIGLFALAVYVAQNYLVALCWAVIIVISVWPAYLRLRGVLGDRRLAAPLIVTLGLAVVLSVPVVLILVEVGREGQSIVAWLRAAQEHGLAVPNWLQNLPILGSQLDGWWRAHLARPQGPAELLGDIDVDTVTSFSRTIGGEVVSRLLLALLTFMAVFVLLRDGESIAAKATAFAETWLGERGGRLERMIALAVRQTVNGTLLVAIGEGALIGAGYVIAGVPHAVLFAILTAALAMLPLGAWIACAIASISLVAVGGSLATAAMVMVWGVVVMLIGDNFITPMLIGGRARLPFLMALIGILGGLETFGLIGLFVGPVAMAALLMVWREWVDATRPKLPSPQPPE